MMIDDWLKVTQSVDEVVVMIIGSNGDVVILITDDYSLISVWSDDMIMNIILLTIIIIILSYLEITLMSE